VTTRTGGVTSILVLVMAFLASCGGDSGAMQATLTDENCTYGGSTALQSGRLAIEIENQTLRFGSFGIVTLWPGETADDLALVEERIASRRLLRNRALSDVPPPLGRWIAGADVEPTTRTVLPVDVDPGRYLVLCYLHPNADERLRASEIAPPERAYVAAQIEVTGAPSYP
jgi:hypothetical protein